MIAARWASLALGFLCFLLTAVRLQVDGITLLGVVFLVVWAWTLGAFTRDFWDAEETSGDDLDAELRALVEADRRES